MNRLFAPLTCTVALASFNVSAATLYVSLQSTNPLSPYSTWANAATNIQHAVDLAISGDTVLVTNGVYAAGSRGDEGNLSRVVITNAIRLESVNGPLVTTIDGGWDGNNYGAGVRCVNLGANAVLSGFTLTNGFAGSQGGGVFCESSGVVTNCVMMGNSAFNPASGGGFGLGGGAYGGSLYHCTLTGNLAQSPDGGGGGGAFGSRLYNCTVAGNYDGGAFLSTLYNCTVTSNAERGVLGSTLYNCTVTSNVGLEDGGGAVGSTLYNCKLNDNRAILRGGGAFGSTLYNCTLTGNSATADNFGSGGGVCESTLYNCTLTGNSAYSGGGASGSTLYSCIVYGNTNDNYTEGTVLNYCLTTPLPTNGVGNITGPPLFMGMAAGDFRLRVDSPGIDAGANLLVLNVGYTYEPTDYLGNTRFIDGNFDGTVAWDIGAYEFNSFRPPRFTSGPRLTANGWQLNITGAADQWVRLQRSSDLRNWEDVSLWPQANPFFMGSEGVKQVNDGDLSQKAMFYRVVVE